MCFVSFFYIFLELSYIFDLVLHVLGFPYVFHLFFFQQSAQNPNVLPAGVYRAPPSQDLKYPLWN